jgi:hypothetical protein
MNIQEGAEGTRCGDGRVVQALLLALRILAHTLHQPQEAGVKPLQGEDESNPAAEQPHSVKECSLQELQHNLGCNAVAHLDMITQNNNSNNGHRYEVHILSYEDTKQIMERRLAHQKC